MLYYMFFPYIRSEFSWFHPCEIIPPHIPLSHIPVPAHGKDNKNEQSHAGSTFIRDIIAMLQLRLHVAFQCIQDFVEAFFMFFSNIN